MKLWKKVLMGALIIAPLMLTPARSNANPISVILGWLFGDGNDGGKKKDGGNPTPPSSGNSVPLNGGLVILLVAGVGLGAKMIYDNNKKPIPVPVEDK